MWGNRTIPGENVCGKYKGNIYFYALCVDDEVTFIETDRYNFRVTENQLDSLPVKQFLYRFRGIRESCKQLIIERLSDMKNASKGVRTLNELIRNDLRRTRFENFLLGELAYQ